MLTILRTQGQLFVHLYFYPKIDYCFLVLTPLKLEPRKLFSFSQIFNCHIVCFKSLTSSTCTLFRWFNQLLGSPTTFFIKKSLI